MTEKLHQGALISTFRKAKKVSTEELAKRTGIARQTIFAHINEHEVLPQKLKICYAFGLNIHISSFDRGVIVPLPNKVDNVKLLSYSLYQKQGRDYITFLKDYFSAITQEIKKAEKSIKVIDYLKTDLNHQLNPVRSQAPHLAKKVIVYRDRYSEYLSAIEEVLENAKSIGKPISYDRFYQSPLSLSETKIGLDSAIHESLDLIYASAIEHIVRLDQKQITASISLLSKPIRPASFIIIDGKTILTEHIYYKRDGKSRLDMLYIEHSDGLKDSFAYEFMESQERRFFDAVQHECEYPLDKKFLTDNYQEMAEQLKKQLEFADFKSRANIQRRLARTEEKIRVLTGKEDSQCEEKI